MRDCQMNTESSFGRRRFLSRTSSGLLGSAAVAASWGIGVRQSAAAETPWRMRLSTSTVHFRDLSFEQACQRIAALGFEAVDVLDENFHCPHLDEIEEKLGVEATKEILKRHGLTLYAITCYGLGYPRYAELLGKLGGHVAVRGSIYGRFAAKDIVPGIKKLLEGLKPQIDLAEKHDAFIAIENHGAALLDSLDSFKAFVELNSSPRIGIAVAPLHLQRGGVAVEDVIAVCGKQLKFFYAWQSGAGLRTLPGHGATDLTPWLAALAKIDYPWYVNPFTHHHVAPDEMSDALGRSVEYLRKCARAVSDS